MERIFKGIILASYNPFFPSARFFTNDQRNGHNVCSELTRFHFWTVVFIWKFASSRCLFRNEKKYRTGKAQRGKNTGSTAASRGGCIFSENTVATLSRHRRSWKEWKNNILTFRAPKFSIPLSYSSRLSMHFFCFSSFSPPSFIHFLDLIWKNKQLPRDFNDQSDNRGKFNIFRIISIQSLSHDN